MQSEHESTINIQGVEIALGFPDEFNFEWIDGLKKVPFGKDWEQFGKSLRDVFFDYFNATN